MGRTITDYLEEPELLDQLAEELTELAKEVIKLARFRRGKNPTDRSETEIVKAIETEMADVLVAAAQLPYRPDWDTAASKKRRWQERLSAKYAAKYSRKDPEVRNEQG